jgi:DNA-binding transcriptional ArsR family regulator
VLSALRRHRQVSVPGVVRADNDVWSPAVGLSQPTASHHLKRLTEAGLLEREQRGKCAYFSLKRKAVERWRPSPTAKECAADGDER